jgi:hypothetical protein
MSIFSAAVFSNSALPNEFKLNCWALDDKPGFFVTVAVSSTDNVTVLKQKIKKESQPRFQDIPAGSLELWKVSIPDTNVKSELQRFKATKEIAGKPLDRPLLEMSTLFPTTPTRMHVHIIVCRPQSSRGISSSLFYRKMIPSI